jgi:dipeptidase E
MKLLLTSGGAMSASIHDALIDLLRKPIAKSTALGVRTGEWGRPMCGPIATRGFVSGGPPWAG